MTANQRGALWMLASATSFTVEAALIKTLGGDYPPTVILFWRQLVCVALLIPLIARSPRLAFSTTRPGLMLLRSGIGVIGLLLAVVAYAELPLADANALSFTRTLWLAILAVLVLAEPLGFRRALAVLVGFVGVLIMLQPGMEGMSLSWAHAAAVGAALLTALTILSVKVMARDHTVFTLTVYAATLGLFLSAPLAALTWVQPQVSDLPALIGLGVFGLITLICYTKGMQMGEAMVMAPMDYSRLVFAAVVGAVVFAEAPTFATVAGAAVIVASTAYLSWQRR